MFIRGYIIWILRLVFLEIMWKCRYFDMKGGRNLIWGKFVIVVRNYLWGVGLSKKVIRLSVVCEEFGVWF